METKYNWNKEEIKEDVLTTLYTFANDNNIEKYIIREKVIIEYKNLTWDEPSIKEWIEEQSKELDEKGNEVINEELKEFFEENIYMEILDNGNYTVTAPEPESINNINGSYTSNTNTIIEDGINCYDWDREEYEKIGEIEEVL